MYFCSIVLDGSSRFSRIWAPVIFLPDVAQIGADVAALPADLVARLAIDRRRIEEKLSATGGVAPQRQKVARVDRRAQAGLSLFFGHKPLEQVADDGVRMGGGRLDRLRFDGGMQPLLIDGAQQPHRTAGAREETIQVLRRGRGHRAGRLQRGQRNFVLLSLFGPAGLRGGVGFLGRQRANPAME